MECILGLHGSVFYMGMRRWVYGFDPNLDISAPSEVDASYIEDRVMAYLASVQPTKEKS
jgi:hypothetical protein